MLGLTSKDHAALAYIYELNEFKSFKKMCEVLQGKAMKQLVAINMGDSDATQRAAMLQGQIESLKLITMQWQLIHNKEVEKAVKEQKH